MNVKVYEVYAFTADGNGGNKAGVVLDASILTDEQMQSIAQKIGAPETAFVLPDKEADHRLRFFTPTVEVNLCGHATVATWSLMNKLGVHGSDNYTQITKAGLIDINVSDDGLIFMEQPVQEFGKFIDPVVIAKELSVPADIIDTRLKPQIVQQALMLGIKTKEMLNSYELNRSKLIEFSKKHDFSGLHMYVMLNSKGITAAVRDFDPVVGIDEDAATGTTNGSFLTYLKHSSALTDQGVYKIEQGEAMGQLSHIYAKFEGERVYIGGYARKSTDRMIEIQ